jgi:hypothetical protein
LGAVVVPLVSVDPVDFFDFLCFFLALVVPLVSVLVWPEVFCAKTPVVDSNERPRAAIRIFFIRGYLLMYSLVVALCALMSIVSNPREILLKYTLKST